MSVVKIVLAGIGGYGRNYVEALIKESQSHGCKIVGTVDPQPEKSPFYETLTALTIPNFTTLEEFYSSFDADLAVISSPIQYHCPQTCLALSRGSHVLCEKPIGATVDEALKMIEARDKAGKFVAIGYQWSFSSSVQALREDIKNGVYGKPKRLKTIVLWPRPYRYYARGWAGKIRDAQGNLINDSVANNATAHYIHNMFYILGHESDRSSRPSRLTAELYRANHIENYDTAAMRTFTGDGTEILYYGSHAVNEKVGAMFCYEFEKADIRFDENKENRIVAQFHDGQQKVYEDPTQHFSNKLWAAVEAVQGSGRIACGLEEALSQTMCIHGMQESAGAIHAFPEERVRREETIYRDELGCYVAGLAEQLKVCYERSILPAEAGFDWAIAGKEVYLPH